MGDEIKVFKLVTGEEVITRVIKEYGDHYTLSKPRVVAIHPGPDGKVAVTLIPLLASSQDGDVQIFKSAIIGQAMSTNSEIERGYIEQTTGIALA